MGGSVGERWPTCDSGVHTWVSRVIDVLCADLGPNLVGAYLHGSLASGSFFRPKSDVDILFVVDQPLDVNARRSFGLSCTDVSRQRPIVGGLECSVILSECAWATPLQPGK